MDETKSVLYPVYRRSGFVPVAVILQLSTVSIMMFSHQLILKDSFRYKELVAPALVSDPLKQALTDSYFNLKAEGFQ